MHDPVAYRKNKLLEVLTDIILPNEIPHQLFFKNLNLAEVGTR
jgi:hypothetical protein